jgi:hypothetical protein
VHNLWPGGGFTWGKLDKSKLSNSCVPRLERLHAPNVDESVDVLHHLIKSIIFAEHGQCHSGQTGNFGWTNGYALNIEGLSSDQICNSEEYTRLIFY